MTTITIKNGQKLTRNSFENLEDLQEHLISVNFQDVFELSDAHKEILDKRLKTADKNPKKGLSWNEVKANITL